MLTREGIQEYIWARYIEFEAPPAPLDEEAALALLDEHYSEHPIAEDAECFYYGILAYERSFANPERRREYLLKAKVAFEAYRDQTSTDFTWDVVDERYQDVMDIIQREGLADTTA